MNGKGWIVIGALLGFLAVALGAFGAHGLESKLSDANLDQATQARLLDNWEVAARYQMFHALAMLALGIIAGRHPSRTLNAAGVLFCLGVLIFSGGLYTYVLTGVRGWALVVPIGGVVMMIGWLALATGAARMETPVRD